jgi:hypothetical protein
MLFSPELDAQKAQITDNVLRESEDFFDEAEDLTVLRNTVRIACEFFDFLKRADSAPDLDEAEYMSGTIRSGIDDFYRMEQWGRILSGLKLKRGFSQNMPSTLSEIKEIYDTVFRQLTGSTSSIESMGLLLSLAQMMLLFMTAYFQVFLSFSTPESCS